MRALLRAAAGRELRIMLPMVTEVDEIRPGPGDARARSDAIASARP
ncbi:MAG: hypothetical protein P0Y66_00105 [Candidatus Kaistia colombiensis]|nr:MAG: hypothetical protein P0Y66_00105 [Kaistia sp.]